MISHDPLDTLSWSDEILVMKDGHILQRGTPQQIYSEPVNEYTAALFGNYNLLSLPEAKSFNFLASVPAGKKLLIRSENFKIESQENSNITGKVIKVIFFGSYYEVEVSVSEIIITVRTKDNNIAKGDTIYLFLASDAVWLI